MSKNTDSRGLSRRRILQGLGSASIVGLAGCSGNNGDGTTTTDGEDGDGTTADDQASEGGKLTLAQVKSPIEFDPIVLNDVPSDEIAQLIYSGLYSYGEGTDLVPELATGEPSVSNDGTEWTVTLREDATFHNGDQVTPEDVRYSFLMPVEEETENASELNMIDSIDIDGQDITFNLTYPYGAFLHNLVWSIVPKSVREEDKDAFNTSQPVGSGPFEFVDWTEGDFVTLERWDDYWADDQPNLAEIEFVPVEEGTTRVTTLRNGDNDVVKEIPPDLWSTVEEMDNASIDSVPGIGYFYLAFNCMEGPTSDPLVREAVDYTFSMDQAVSNFVEPTGLRQYSPLPRPIAEDWDMPLDEWEQIPHDKDIDAAKELFDEAGISMDYQWNIIVPPDDKREQLGVTVSNGLQEAGFSNVSVQRLDWGTFLDKYVSGDEDDYNMYTLGWSGTPDPDAFTYFLLARTDDVLGVNNGTFWGEHSEKGVEAAQLFADARESADREERQQMYREGITMALEDRAHLPAYNLKNSFGVNDYVSDFASHPTD
ncbi:MAG: ABC transporter substrate-binding protein, partial [Halanaeroarchaeum sp.]